MQLRITKEHHADYPAKTVGRIVQTYKGDHTIKDGWAVEVESRKEKGKMITIYVPADCGEVLPDTSGTAEDTIFIAAINRMAEKVHGNARDKGFWEERDAVVALCEKHGMGEVARKLVDSQLRELIISEISEATEGDRKDLMDDHLPQYSMVVCELADAVIRALDYSAARKMPLAEVILAKHKYNTTRPRKHGKLF